VVGFVIGVGNDSALRGAAAQPLAWSP
jgi:hypothetical protein